MTDQSEQRRFPFRPESRNLVHFAITGDEGCVKIQGMGRTLNISRGGILLESKVAPLEMVEVTLSLGLRDEILVLQARVVHVRQSSDGLFASGMEFCPMSGPKAKLLSEFIENFESVHDNNC